MNIKKIADDVRKSIKDPDFESFIAEQIISMKSSKDEEPCFSIVHEDVTLDIWKDGLNYNLVSSVLPGTNKKARKNFKKEMKKKELIEEIMKTIDGFLD